MDSKGLSRLNIGNWFGRTREALLYLQSTLIITKSLDTSSCIVWLDRYRGLWGSNVPLVYEASRANAVCKQGSDRCAVSKAPNSCEPFYHPLFLAIFTECSFFMFSCTGNFCNQEVLGIRSLWVNLV
jgi:hypothetical protein